MLLLLQMPRFELRHNRITKQWNVLEYEIGDCCGRSASIALCSNSHSFAHCRHCIFAVRQSISISIQMHPEPSIFPHCPATRKVHFSRASPRKKMLLVWHMVLAHERRRFHGTHWSVQARVALLELLSDHWH